MRTIRMAEEIMEEASLNMTEPRVEETGELVVAIRTPLTRKIAEDINKNGFDDIAVGPSNDASGFYRFVLGISGGFANIGLIMSSLSGTKHDSKFIGVMPGSEFVTSIDEAGIY